MLKEFSGKAFFDPGFLEARSRNLEDLLWRRLA
jgi:hypothetical protein